VGVGPPTDFVDLGISIFFAKNLTPQSKNQKLNFFEILGGANERVDSELPKKIVPSSRGDPFDQDFVGPNKYSTAYRDGWSYKKVGRRDSNLHAQQIHRKRKKTVQKHGL
jgi:hypothetical protein